MTTYKDGPTGAFTGIQGRKNTTFVGKGNDKDIDQGHTFGVDSVQVHLESSRNVLHRHNGVGSAQNGRVQDGFTILKSTLDTFFGQNVVVLIQFENDDIENRHGLQVGRRCSERADYARSAGNPVATTHLNWWTKEAKI